MRDWASEKVCTLLGFYMLLQGMAVALLGDGRLNGPSNLGLREFADVINASPRVIVFIIFGIPGLLIILRKARKVGLLLAVLTFALFGVGNIRAMFVNADATIMAPITYAFLATLAAWLFTTERYTR